MSAAPQRIPAIEALVAGAASDGDAAADVAGGGVGLEVAALLADRVGDQRQAQIGAIVVCRVFFAYRRRRGGFRFLAWAGSFGVTQGSQTVVGIVEGLGGVGVEAGVVAVAAAALRTED